ncbi:DUF4019 domain-containing protein [Novosphingobium mangrovi (ex Huang et al. 2023)]|uniref:DUF4019 domain-containing protein n=1 Tax=Novosphingobium mangrovi (ex Huang et al. 2023) TaxID=2976432 RepID=A0ABT2I741_9SPHN|nr:DUF4019 domain-containing protein [Novosphingobium mangrovi (ex Huang et al. 2023)]MCT2400637.1 DUF4019 domain-containing protein [Novosphingobium mangrovi (ex Huang et al. 2023)]
MLAGCGVKESIEDASAQVDQFHAALDAGDWQAVWKRADPELRKATRREQFGRLLKAVHRKLGNVQSSRQVGWNANATTGGSFVTLTMQTTFEKGVGTEQFVYRKGDGGKLMLVGYDIQSQDMMLN